MKQVLQSLKTGEVEVTEVPAPVVQRGRVLVRAAASLISAGTERAAVDTNRKSLVARALEQPELVKKTLLRAKDEGIANTLSAVRSKLDSTLALGYSAAGRIVAVGEDAGAWRVGERVACAGLGYASHAEVLSVPQNLCVRLPEEVSYGEAAYGTLGAIALQGVRLASPTLGEACVVIGLGLLGQLTVQLLKANGCRVYGIDLDARRIELARTLGAEDGCAPDEEAARRVFDWTRGRGADAVLITAATESNQPVELAGEVSRLKGRVVAVGGVGLEVPRDLYFKRELSLQVSMSYGPGRYDPDYEERGRDYPFAYVRWTEGRNIEAFLDLVAARSVNVERLTTHRFAVEDAASAYRVITGETKEPSLGVLLEYDTEREVARRVELSPSKEDARARVSASANGVVRVGLVGAGGYAKGMLLPQFKAEGAEFQTIATASGVTALNVGRQYGFRACASGADEVIADEQVNLVVIATRHDTHARLARAALERGRHVFVEKPLALDDAELDDVLDAAARSDGRLIVGFNRRFSPLARAAREFFEGRREPLSMVYRVNAGRLPREHWAHDPREGGGRIVAEVCHFVDLMQFWTGAPPVRVYVEPVASRNHEVVEEDSVMITLRFADGSNGTIAYLAEGDRAMPKERAEIFGEGRVFLLEDFRGATTYRNGREEVIKQRAQDKGQREEVSAACAVVLGKTDAPISLAELASTTRATFRMRESLRTGLPMNV
jgi:polar amino acid transport system substrate-binding protein